MKKIEFLGSGCAKCTKLYELTQQAVRDTGLDATVEKVSDLPTIMGYGVMITPALVVDGKVVASGKVPSVKELAKLIGA